MEGREAKWDHDVLCHFALVPHADSKLNGQDLGAGPCQSSLEKIKKFKYQTLGPKLMPHDSCHQKSRAQKIYSLIH